VARFVLVHGAWHGGWCFAGVAAALEARGHEVEAVDLPCDRPGLTVQDYAATVGPRPRSVVVGHSLGALSVALVDAQTRVYLAPVLPVENAYDECFAQGFGGYVRDELGRSYWPDADTCAAKMYPDCTRERSDWAFARLRRQAPLDAIVAPLGPGDVVIATCRDTAVDFEWQVRAGRAHGARVVELDTGHSPFFTHPQELAGLLVRLA